MQGDRRKAISELIRTAYENPVVVSRYVTVGLWQAEEILVADFVPDDARVLDLGCGAGRFTVALAELGLQVVGIDISSAMVEAAREQARLAMVEERTAFEVMDAMSMTLPDESFDVALFAYNGIELVPGREGKKEVFDEVHRVLKPGGRFIFSAHSPFALNVHLPTRIRAFLRFCFGRVFGWPVREHELGERFIDNEWEEAKYLQILPPWILRRILVESGFQISLYNTRLRLEKGRAMGVLGHFEDGERFYVAVKPRASRRPSDTAPEYGEDQQESGGH
ncbi:MAG: class I SAM-dependent methyltransferase [Candidatus Latescibacterota bacterium]|nr:class I SAM-dependent methyltransferase [Candidatus Latescibacterota bacterium]